MTRPTRFAPFALVIALALGAAACGGSSDSASTKLGPEAEAGETIFQGQCTGCHSVDGQTKVGPSFKGLSGSAVSLESGQSVTADDAYLTKSILDPSADVVKGYQDIMSSAVPAGSITDEQAKQLVAYINTLK